MSTATKKFDTLEKLRNRQELIIGGRLKDKERILLAVKRQDSIRKRLSAKLAASESAAIIRKFRDSR